MPMEYFSGRERRWLTPILAATLLILIAKAFFFSSGGHSVDDPDLKREWENSISHYDPVSSQSDIEEQIKSDGNTPLTKSEVTNMPSKFQEAYQLTVDNDTWRDQNDVSSEEWRQAVMDLSRGRPLSVPMNYDEVRRHILRNRGR
jgi:hypothetical protein